VGREITLSSLSTGDYKNIDQLILFLTDKYKVWEFHFLFLVKGKIIFLSKSWKFRSEKKRFNLCCRNSEDNWQLGLNEVSKQKRSICWLVRKKRVGVLQVYFMIGLPL
jgi:hypothetical protein